MKQSRYILQVNNLSVFFESSGGFVRAVDEISFDMESHKILSIIGESGAGKTVLISSICGTLNGEPGIVKGDIIFNGQKLTANLHNCVNYLVKKEKIFIKKNDYSYMKMLKGIRNKLRKDISLIFQDPRKSLDPLFTIEDQMKEALKLKLGSKFKLMQPSEIDETIIDWLEKVKIFNPQKVIKQFPDEISGGMLQRVMIAISMIIEPKLLIADEPTTALDISTTVHIIDLLLEFYESANISLLFATHDISLAKNISDSIMVMNSGQVVEYGDNSSIFNNNYKHPYTKSLLKAKLNPMNTNINTPIHVVKDRSADEIYFDKGCKFRERCEHADSECSMINKWINISDYHSIYCKNIQNLN